ncbi:olfactory receptor 10C1-like [Morone saxatilis]|uniref:olfactory receptor 10C1-like n=1 Tax=Morone saxatilis TaxID=34816 RepID=UPI0015E20879|nr:olfactory receptor 10C1-like [Morone saxatilis]
MTSAGFNVTSAVTSLTLEGLAQLSEHRSLWFALFLSLYVFVLSADSLVVYLICSQRTLHRPMFAFVAAVLLNSAAASTSVYTKLLSELMSGHGVVQVSRSGCLGQAFVLMSLGGSSFMLLSAMAFDRYLSICRPLRYAALVTPAAVAALLLLCWLLPAAMVGGAVLLASRLPLCRSRLSRIYCDVYSFVSLSCGGGATLLSEVYGLITAALTVFFPAAFVLFSYGRVLSVCLRSSRSFSSKALHTCLPHLLVFFNYSLSTSFELLQRRLQARSEPAASILPSVLMVVVPTVLNPVVYGLKVNEIYRHVKRVLGCQRAA